MIPLMTHLLTLFIQDTIPFIAPSELSHRQLLTILKQMLRKEDERKKEEEEKAPPKQGGSHLFLSKSLFI